VSGLQRCLACHFLLALALCPQSVLWVGIPDQQFSSYVGCPCQPGRAHFGQVFGRGCLASSQAARVAARHAGLACGLVWLIFYR
jgi:hypothetical protein